MAETTSRWKTDSSGGFLRAFEGTVIDSYFATDPKYNEGNSLALYWICSVDNLDEALEAADIDLDDEQKQHYVDEGIRVQLPCGSNWRTEDGGKTAEHPRGKNRDFHASSLVGKVINSITGELEHYGDAAKATDGSEVKVDLTPAMKVLEERGAPQNADVWNGLKWRFQEVAFDYGKNRQTGEAMKSQKSMPVEFLGVVDGAKKAATATPVDAKADKVAEAKKKAADKKAAASKPADGGDALSAKLTELGATDEQVKGLTAALAQASNVNEFSDLAIDIEGITENDGLMEAVVDESSDGLFALKSS